MLRTLAILIACHGVARADFGEQLDGELDAALVLGPPDDIPTHLTPADRERREAMFLGAFPGTLHPFAKANLWLSLGDLELAEAIEKKRIALAMLEARDFGGAIHLEGEIGSALYNANSNYVHATMAKHAKWRGLPRALAHHAYTLDLAKSPEALVVHRRLVTEHPASPYAARSHVVLGDILYAASQPFQAAKHYAAVDTTDPLLQGYALFKRAMLHLRDHAPDQAYAKLEAALVLALPPLLAGEVRRATTRAYAGFADASEAFEKFAQLAPLHAKEMTIELARQYQAARQDGDAATVFAQLVRRFPTDREACSWQIPVTQAANLGTDAGLLFREAQRLVRIYDRTRFVLAPEERALCRRMVLEFTTELAGTTLDKSLARQLADLAHGLAE